MQNLVYSAAEVGFCIVAPQTPPCDRLLIADIILQSYNAAKGKIRRRSCQSSFRANGAKRTQRGLYRDRAARSGTNLLMK